MLLGLLADCASEGQVELTLFVPLHIIQQIKIFCRSIADKLSFWVNKDSLARYMCDVFLLKHDFLDQIFKTTIA